MIFIVQYPGISKYTCTNILPCESIVKDIDISATIYAMFRVLVQESLLMLNQCCKRACASNDIFTNLLPEAEPLDYKICVHYHMTSTFSREYDTIERI